MAKEADVVFMLDSSNSQGPENFNTQKEFVKTLVQQVFVGPDDIQFGVMSFESEPHQQFYLNDYYNETDVLNAIDAIPFHTGNTLTGPDFASI